MLGKEKVFKITRQIDGWLSDREGIFLYEMASQCTGKGVIVEIGSWHGKSTIWLAAGSKDYSKTKVYAIDHHQGSEEITILRSSCDTFSIFIENIRKAGLDDIVEPILMTSEQAWLNFNQHVELLFIDGSHTLENVLKDFILWQQKLIKGGILLLHDFTYWPAVQKIARWFILNLYLFDNIKLVDSILCAKKI